MSKTKIIQHGPFELRYVDIGDGKFDLDEILMYIAGECVFHLERMGDELYWMGLYSEDKWEMHANVFAANMKSLVNANVTEISHGDNFDFPLDPTDEATSAPTT